MSCVNKHKLYGDKKEEEEECDGGQTLTVSADECCSKESYRAVPSTYYYSTDCKSRKRKRKEQNGKLIQRQRKEFGSALQFDEVLCWLLG